MKKAKLMSTAITVLAVVGGGLAIKANRFSCTIYCETPISAFYYHPVNGFTIGAISNIAFC